MHAPPTKNKCGEVARSSFDVVNRYDKALQDHANAQRRSSFIIVKNRRRP
jgi:hypothetical protein